LKPTNKKNRTSGRKNATTGYARKGAKLGASHRRRRNKKDSSIQTTRQKESACKKKTLQAGSEGRASREKKRAAREM